MRESLFSRNVGELRRRVVTGVHDELERAAAVEPPAQEDPCGLPSDDQGAQVWKAKHLVERQGDKVRRTPRGAQVERRCRNQRSGIQEDVTGRIGVPYSLRPR